jgi:hypothetical protein
MLAGTLVPTHKGGKGKFSAVQAAQMYKLLSLLYFEQKPILLVGDLKSDPEDGIISNETYGDIFPPYMQAMGAGYMDVWSLKKQRK